jgi:hypothetical protein
VASTQDFQMEQVNDFEMEEENDFMAMVARTSIASF